MRVARVYGMIAFVAMILIAALVLLPHPTTAAGCVTAAGKTNACDFTSDDCASDVSGCVNKCSGTIDCTAIGDQFLCGVQGGCTWKSGSCSGNATGSCVDYAEDLTSLGFRCGYIGCDSTTQCDGLISCGDSDCSTCPAQFGACKLDDGCSCTNSTYCNTGACKTDYDGSGSWCGASASCWHNSANYSNSQYSPDTCYADANASIAGSRAQCSAGSWTGVTCGYTAWNQCTSSCIKGRDVYTCKDADNTCLTADNCYGTPHACAYYTGGGDCGTAGCSWNGTNCSGSPYPCSTFGGNSGNCGTIGCSFQSGTTGTANTTEVGANSVCSGGSEVDATNAGLACDGDTDYFCADGACSGYYRYSECDGAGSCDTSSSANYQQYSAVPTVGYTLTTTCGATGLTYCAVAPATNLYGSACDAGQACQDRNTVRTKWTVQNVTTLTITPIQGWCNGTNLRSESVWYRWQWFRNGTLNASGISNNSNANYTQGVAYNVANLSPRIALKGEYWNFSCQATSVNGTINSSWTNTTSVWINNTPPLTNNIVMNSTTGMNWSQDNLTAYPNIDEPDPVDVNYTAAVDWRVNGQSIAVANLDFDFNNSGGTNKTRDYSIYNNTGTANNLLWNATGGVNGTGAYYFSGATNTSYVTLGNASSLNIVGTAITVEAWIKPTSFPNVWSRIVAKEIPGNADPYFTYSLYMTASAGTVNWGISTGGAGSGGGATTTSAIPLNQWTYIVGTYDGKSARIYVNGVLNYSNPKSGNLGATARPVLIGNENEVAGGEYFIGYIDDVRIHNRTLTAEQIAANYANHNWTAANFYEVGAGQNWSACAVAQDGIGEGNVSCSANATIVSSVPNISGILVNATSNNNYTTDNITAYVNVTDPNNDTIGHVYDWRVNGSSFMTLNMPFDIKYAAGTNPARDYSTLGNNATEYYTTWNATGGYNNSGAYFFNGTASYLTVPSNLDSPNMTVMAWVNFTGVNSQINTIFGNKGYDGCTIDTTHYGFEVYINAYNTNNRQVIVEYGNGSSGCQGLGTATGIIPNNVWTHVAVVWDATNSNLTIYVNGTNAASTNFARPLSQQSVFMIGKFMNGGLVHPYRGYIDEVRVYNRSLTQQQIQLIYQNRSEVVGDRETAHFENWSVCDTPNDGFKDGARTCSNGQYIGNRPPYVVTINNPVNGTVVVTDYPNLNVTVQDDDNDSLTVKFINASSNTTMYAISGVYSGSFNYTMPNLSQNTTYFWCVNVSDGYETTTTCNAPHNFTTITTFYKYCGPAGYKNSTSGNASGNWTLTANYTLATDVVCDNIIVTNGSSIIVNSSTAGYRAINITANTLLINTSASINMRGTGYAGGPVGSGTGYGPGNGTENTYGGGGASHAAAGGYGGNGGTSGAPGTRVYGNVTWPTTVGSGGGGSWDATGGAGGGAATLNITGIITINGTIVAEGTTPSSTSYGGGGGSGGSVLIIAGTIDGNGNVSANGGSGRDVGSTDDGGAGSGGRIALYYSTYTYTGNVTARSGVKTTSALSGGAGTIYYNGSNALIISNGAEVTTAQTNITGQQSAYDTINITNSSVVHAGLTAQTVNIIQNGIMGGRSDSAITTTNLTTYGEGTCRVNSNVTAINATTSGTGNATLNGTLSVDYLLINNNITEATTAVTNRTLIKNGSQLSQPGNTYTQVYALNLTSVNITIETNASINVSGKGYAGGPVGSGTGYGPGNGTENTYGGGGASHGGMGGNGGNGGGSGAAGTRIYGNITWPITIGSGGGGSNDNVGGNGGGAAYLNASDTLTVNGTIAADGATPVTTSYGGGGGSGGSVLISANTILGNTSISANGAQGRNVASVDDGGSGGAGRIAIYYSTNGYSGLILARGGAATSAIAGGPGTVYLKGPANTNGDLYINNGPISSTVPTNITGQQSIYDTVNITNSTVILPSVTAQNVNTIQNALLGQRADSAITAPNITTLGAGTATLNATLTANDLLINNSLTEAVMITTNRTTVKSSSTLSHMQNTYTQLYLLNLTSVNVTVETNASINVSGKGYTGGPAGGGGNGNGPGNGTTGTYGGGGASHGGMGGNGGNGGGAGAAGTRIYGNITWPITIGSGGGGSNDNVGGNGGGAANINVSDTLMLNGTLAADGSSPTNTGYGGGGGSGGSILLMINAISGNGTISANGGQGRDVGSADDGGSGGGGRIAIYYTIYSYNGGLISKGGLASTSARPGGAGTAYLKGPANTNGDLYINNVNMGTTTPTNITGQQTTYDTINITNSSAIHAGLTAQLVNVIQNGVIGWRLDSIITALNFTTMGEGTCRVNSNITANNVTTTGSGYATLNGTVSADNLLINNSITEATVIIANRTVVKNVSQLSHPANTNTQVYILNISSVNLTIETNGTINVSGKGYAGGPAGGGGNGYGPGNGTTNTYGGGGASHAGMGGAGNRAGANPGTRVYSNVTWPTTIGSGGGGSNDIVGGAGGGAAYISITDTLTVNGTITADGATSSSVNYGAGGGSGGSLLINTTTLNGVGNITANGGAGKDVGSTDDGGSGGGGAIAVYYTNRGHNGTIIARGGVAAASATAGGPGWVYLKGPSNTYGDLYLNNALQGTTTPTNITGQQSIYDTINITNSTVFLAALSAQGVNVLQNALLGQRADSNISAPNINTFGIGTATINATMNANDLLVNDTLTEATIIITNRTTVKNSATLSHIQNTNTQLYGLNITSVNITVEANSSINVSGKGYSGGPAGGGGNGYGPGNGTTGTYGGGGASHAGMGGAGNRAGENPGTRLYGNITWPISIGSGGGGSNDIVGGTGGGMAYLSASDTLTVNGTIAADGATSSSVNYGAGGGAGGSLLINVLTIGGSGNITANGGAGKDVGSTDDGGSGGGGRIALYYTVYSFSGMVYARGGLAAASATAGGAGSIYYKGPANTNGDLYINNGLGGITTPTNITGQQNTYDTINITNSTVILPSVTAQNFNTIQNALVGQRSDSGITAPNVSTRGTGTATLNASISANDFTINNTVTEATVVNANRTFVRSGSQLSHPSNTNAATYSLNVTTVNMSVETGSSINATAKGFAGGAAQSTGYGPGGGYYGVYGGGGASHSGYGSNGQPGLGNTVPYGNITWPTSLGSGGAGGLNNIGGAGGGLIFLNVTDTIDNNGTIEDNGDDGKNSGDRASGAGSGGSVIIVARNITGNGSMNVNGGNAKSTSSNGGAGGAGRIALYYNSSAYNGSITAIGGLNLSGILPGGPGTKYLKSSSAQYGDLAIDNGPRSTFTATNISGQQQYYETMNISNSTVYGGMAFTSSFNAINNVNLYLAVNTTNFTAANWSAVNMTVLNATYVFIMANGSISHPANTNAQTYMLNITATNVTIAAGGAINITGKGYAGGAGSGNGYGPGAGAYGVYAGGGASHGGAGSNGNPGIGGTAIYDNVSWPVGMGSGGGGGINNIGGAGGGFLKLNITGTLVNNGTIENNGEDGKNAGDRASGAGSGGSTLIITDALTGNGSITVNGGNAKTASSNGGAGGGGRMALAYINNTLTGAITTNGGAPVSGILAGQDGSIFACQYTAGFTCPDAYGSISLNTNFSRNYTVNYTRTLITPWNSSFVNWSDASNMANATANYNITGLNTSNLYKVFVNESLNQSLMTTAAGSLNFSENVSRTYIIKVVEGNVKPSFTARLNGSNNKTSVYDNENLLCMVNVSDADDFTDTVYWTFYNGSANFSNGTTVVTSNATWATAGIVNYTYTNVGENWTCSAVVADAVTNASEQNDSKIIYGIALGMNLTLIPNTTGPGTSYNATGYVYYSNGDPAVNAIVSVYRNGTLESISSTPSATSWANSSFGKRKDFNITEPRGYVRTSEHARVAFNFSTGEISKPNNTIMYCNGNRVQWDAYSLNTTGGYILQLEGLMEFNLSARQTLNCSLYYSATAEASNYTPNVTGWKYFCDNDFASSPTAPTLTPAQVEDDNLTGRVSVWNANEAASCGGATSNFAINSWCYLKAVTNGSTYTETCSDDGSTCWTEGTQYCFNQYSQGETCRGGSYASYVKDRYYAEKVTYDQGGGGYVFRYRFNSSEYIDTECYPYYGDSWLVNITYGANASLSMTTNESGGYLATLAAPLAIGVYNITVNTTFDNLYAENSSLLNVTNTLPAFALQFNGSTAIRTNITCYMNVTDPDLGQNWTANWTVKNGTAVYATGQTNITTAGVWTLLSTVNMTKLNVGDVWNCTANVFDGNDAAANQTASIAIIGQLAPNVSNVILNSTNGTNYTTENITAYVNASDPNNDAISLIHDWRLNGTSIAVLNMNFDVNNSAGSGKARDYSMFGNNGTNYGTTWLATGGVNGTGAYSFSSASSNNMSMGSASSLNIKNSSTIMMWVYRSDTGVDRTIMCYPGKGSFKVYSDNKLETWWGADGMRSVGGGATLGATTWYHLAVTVSGTTMTTYVNGQQDRQKTGLTGAGDLNAGLTLGPANCGGSFFDGRIDDVRIYNRSLSSDEIYAIYSNRSDRVASAELAPSDNWTDCVTANDGYNDSATACSANLSVRWSAPIISNITINTSLGTFSTSNNVSVTAINITSLTGASNVNTIYDWRESNASLAVLNMNFDVNNSAGTGMTRDYSAYNNNGSVTNAAWNASGGWNGSGAYRFNGTYGLINLSTASTLALYANYTLSAWIYQSAAASDNPIISRSTPTQNTYGFGTSSGILYLGWWNGAGVTITSNMTLQTNQWYHVVGAVNGSHQLLYINGALMNTSAYAGVATAAPGIPAYIGHRADGSASTFNGTIDNVRIYNRTLSPEEIAALYNNRSDLLVSQELRNQTNYSVCAVANDGALDGNTLCSNAILIGNQAPVMAAIAVNSTRGANTTSENLTAYPNATDYENDTLRYTHDWRVNGTSFAALNMNFDANNSAGSGMTKDYSTYGRNGTVYNAIWNATGGMNGSGAYMFRGTAAADNITMGGWFTYTTFTIAMWVKPGAQGGSYNILIDNNHTGARSWTVQASGNNNYCFYVNPGAICAAVNLAPNVWQHVVLQRRSDGEIAVYINNTLVQDIAGGTLTYDGTQGLRIGAWGGGGRYWNGTMDSLAIYDRWLSPQEINALYNNRTDLIASQELTSGNNWTDCATPNDGTTEGNTLCSGGLQVIDHLPTINITVNSTTGINNTRDNLTAYVTNLNDTDNDNVSVIHDWRINGTSIATLNMNFDVDNNGGSRKTRDYSSYGNNGTVNLSVWNATGGYNGTGAYQFSGVTGYIDAGTFNMGSSQQMTMSAWINPRSSSGNNFIVFKGNDATSNSYGLWVSGGHIGMEVYTTSLQNTYFPGGAALNTWQHVVGVISGNTMYLYINGTLRNTSTFTGTISDSGTSVWIGGQSRGDPYKYLFNGTIDNVVLFNRSLSSQEVLALYSNQTNLLVSQELRNGTNWTDCVTPNDGYADGLTNCSNAVYIGNHIPTINVTINSSTVANNTQYNLTAYVNNASDPDGDNISVVHDWRVNGTSIAVLNMNFDVNNSAGSGKTRDYSTFGNNGTVNNTAYWNATGGWNGTGAYRFDGLCSNKINYTPNALPNTVISVEAWVNAAKHKNWNRVVSHNWGVNGGWLLFSDSSGIPYFGVYDNGGQANAGGSAMTAGTWYHLVGTYNGTNVSIYINGVYAGGTTQTGTLDATSVVEIGATLDCYNGTIDNVRVYNRTLSAQEILALYNNQTNKIVSQELRNGNNWTDCATPNDGTNDGATNCSNSVYISNNLPTATIVLNSTNGRNTTSEDLTGYTTITDIDADSTNVAYDWRLNGTSIAVLNMNFDVNNSAGTNKTRDYSVYSTNGTVINAAWNATGGWNGTGAYTFNGTNTFITTAANDPLDNSQTGTVTMWIKTSSTATTSVFSYTTTTFLSSNFIFEIANGVPTMEWNAPGGGGWSLINSTTAINNGQWHFVAFASNGTGNDRIYVDGNAETTNYASGGGTSAQSDWFADTYLVGNYNHHMDIGATNRSSPFGFFNGSIDNVQVYNRSLSAQEIAAIYNNQSNKMVSNELAINQTWSVCATPNDGQADGATVCSVNLTIIPVTDSCTPPGPGNNWVVNASDQCVKQGESIDLGTGKFFLQGTGFIKFVNSIIMARDFIIQASGGPARIYLENRSLVVRPMGQ